MSSKTRSIFEEVDQEVPVETPKGGMISGPKGDSRKTIATWLLVLFAMVLAMIIVGGLTRLTDSGLSITEWKPITGAVPPLSAEAWDSEFEKYKAIPEYQLQNKGMSLSEFKYIYWWEWGHRQLGRLVGLVWAVGFAFFYFTKRIPRGWTGRLLGVGALGGLQGFIGWWMVSSGLSGRVVDVASYRLATHLGLAFIILSVLIWYVWQLKRGDMDLIQAQRDKDTYLIRLGQILVGLVFVQILLGALVAGIDAGRGYTDWPMMGGEFLPSESFHYTPAWTNFFENPALVQFNHRMMGYILMGYAIWVWLQSRSSGVPRTKSAFTWTLIFITGQMLWGIITVMNAAPVGLAIFHQLGAVFVMVLALNAVFNATYPRSQKLR